MNPYYNATGFPVNSQEGDSADARAESQAVQAAFDMLPALLGNDQKLLMVKAGALGLTVTPGTGIYQMNVPWTPVLSCAVPGDLNIVYSLQTGLYHRIGQLVLATFEIQTSTFTHTTSSGGVTIGALPVIGTGLHPHIGTLEYSGYTKANYPFVVPSLGVSSVQIILKACGTGQPNALVAITDFPTAGQVILRGMLLYLGQ